MRETGRTLSIHPEKYGYMGIVGERFDMSKVEDWAPLSICRSTNYGWALTPHCPLLPLGERVPLFYFYLFYLIEKNMSRDVRKPTFWFQTCSDTNKAVQLQKMARGLKFRIKKVEGLYYLCSENKGADQLRA